MRIGLISDTHIPVDARELPHYLESAFHGVDLILHAGDVYAPGVLEELGAMAPLLAAKGDDDYGDVLRDERMKEEHILTYEGITLWLFHEYKKEFWIDKGRFCGGSGRRFEKDPDIIIYGHTHKADLRNHGSILTITPGSATFPNYVSEPGTVGLLTLKSGRAEAQIIQLQ
jgi:putative phosphoesterase